MNDTCYFCGAITNKPILGEHGAAVALADNFPVSPGHTLIVSRRHVGSFFALTRAEQIDMLELLDAMQRRLAVERAPDGWNIGVNVGAAGGQTIAHVHMHLIPRYAGDLPDPRGGVRWVLPAHAVPTWGSDPTP